MRRSKYLKLMEAAKKRKEVITAYRSHNLTCEDNYFMLHNEICTHHGTLSTYIKDERYMICSVCGEILPNYKYVI